MIKFPVIFLFATWDASLCITQQQDASRRILEWFFVRSPFPFNDYDPWTFIIQPPSQVHQKNGCPVYSGPFWKEFLAFVIVDLTHHCKWYTSQVQNQPCMGNFPSLGSHPVLRTGLKLLLKLQWQGKDYSLKLAAKDLQPCGMNHSTHFL